MKKIKFILAITVFGLCFTTCTSEIDEIEDFEEHLILDDSRSSTALYSPCDDCDQNSTTNFNDAPEVNELVRLQKRSVGLIYTNKNNPTENNRLCSGTLINNPNQKLYFLTAAHCVSPEVDKILPPQDLDRYYNDLLTNLELNTTIQQVNSNALTNMINWGIRFFFECDSNEDFIVDGLRLISLNPQTDMALFEVTGLNNNTPINQDRKEKLCLSGWNRNGSSNSDQAIDIHHPRGKPQRVAIANGYVTFNNSHPINMFPSNLDKSKFWYTNFTVGGLHHGSSGSGLINSNEQLVGYLTGGDENNIVNCENKQVVFGKLSEAWSYSATDSSSPLRTLQSWLGTSITMNRLCFGPTNPPNTTCDDTYIGASNLAIQIINPNCNFPQLNCGRIKLVWTPGTNVTYNIYRQVNRGPVVLIRDGLNSYETQFEDEEARTWANNVEIKYFLESVNPCDEVINPNGSPNISRAHALTYGGLINF